MKQEKLRIIPLGGLNEFGKNMTVFEYEDEMIIVDCGLKFPEDEMLGIDIVIPDISFLRKNKDKIKGLLLTHGHEDHIGAIPYVLREIEMPIYGTKLTIGMVEKKLKEFTDLKNVNLNVINIKRKLKLGHFKVEPIRVSHSIPDAVSFCIETPIGRVIHTGDFKVDYTPIDNQRINLQKFAHLGAKGVLALLAESSNAGREGYTMSESTVGDTFETIFRHAENRIIVASFASHIHRIQQIVNAARANNRKVCFSGRSMVANVDVGMELGYLKIPKNMIIDISDLNGYPDNEVVLVTTGTQGEPMAALSRMANSSHRQVSLQPGDLVILSSTPIPGNEKSVNKVINKLYEKGAEVIYNQLADVHVSGHACKEELKLIHSLVKPKYFMPIHGDFSNLKQHAGIAQKLGMSQDNIFILENGNVLEFTKEGASMGQPVESGMTLIDGLGIGDVGNIVLRDRRILSEEGLIIVIVGISRETGKFVSGPDIISRGFVYVRESEELMNNAKEIAEKTIAHCENQGIKEWSSIKYNIKNDLGNYLYHNMRRRPMILPIIMDV